MRLFTNLQTFWQQKSLRLQLMIVIASVGLFALLLNAVLLGTFLNTYFLDRQGTQMVQQAEALGQCCQSNNHLSLLLHTSPQAMARIMQMALADSPGRRVVIIDAQGTLRYATPMPAALLQTLLAHERHDLIASTALSTTAAPHWELQGDQIMTDVRVSNIVATGTTSQKQIVGAVLLDEDLKVERLQWSGLLALITLPAGAAIVLILLGGIAAAHFLARPLGEVTAVAQDIAIGNYTRRVIPMGPAEMYTLGHSFNRMIDEVLHQQRIERDLLANVSHELASPLGLIRGYAEALIDGVIDDEAQRLITLRAISTETTRLVRLSGDLLDLALLETGQIVLYREPVPVNELLAGLYERFTPLAKQTGVTLDFAIPSHLPLVQTDGLRLEQVLVNLLNNALHSTPAGGTISISASHVGTQLQLDVSDTGQGISSEKLSRIWERFYQVDTARDRRTGAVGVGLGLAICRGIIARLDGEITVASTVGQGTTFTILLPIRSGSYLKVSERL
ncbi:MAG TPA: HAMP domain-containing sensor histidine kinase [Ktedonobacteraceae bacterium]|jgi:signal transduction histidine kinase